MNANGKYLRAMVIDDEALMRKLTGLQLRALGCQSVECHSDGSAALSTLSQKPDEIDLIVCDLQMPVMDGVEVLRGLSAMGFGGAVIVVSGEGQRTLAAAERLAQAHGLDLLGVLKKPVEPARLAWLLEKLVPDKASARSQRHLSAEDLACGLATGQLTNHYQPKVCLQTGKVVGVEALVRWQHPTLGLIFPEEFIPVAESSGLIDRLTRSVIDGPGGALRHLKQWHDAGLDLHVAVNVSMDNLLDLSFPDFVMRAAQNVGVNLTHLVLEVTESRLSTDTKLIADVLTRLRLKRLRLAIDDFGTGYSSLAQLHEWPFDELKVDKRFVHRAHEDHVIGCILDASLNMAKELGLSTTGEGVETLADWHHLQRKGCDLAQGYWIAKPMPPEQVPTWLLAWRERTAAQSDLFAQAQQPVARCAN
jgi:EAL domain-containing protein (putative c-di-GMP-specific phosphodiesterase class I)/AmiR/NasT family two-component response regulator